MSQPLLKVEDLCRFFISGEEKLTVLNHINLEIYQGEMVAIVGASGSGKSTLMNILGCLDKPSSGRYLINNKETSAMDGDQLAQLRREYFGFIFQRYHLLSDLTAVGNVEVPAVYSGSSRAERDKRAKELLSRLGLEDRFAHKPNQLSGGQQQRVSVARALMNGGDVILADEPTGALDSQSGKEMMALLKELHQMGHTIILVTHDMDVANFADRIIEIKDGEILSDTQVAKSSATPSAKPLANNEPQELSQAPVDDKAQTNKITHRKTYASHWWHWASILDALKMSLLAMSSHKMRTFLTMLGIIIGIASVVSVVALGNGTQKQILENIASMGTNTIEIFPGSGFGDRRSGRIRTLTADDAEALKSLSFVEGVTPKLSSSVTVRFANQNKSATVEGVGTDFFTIKNYQLASGQFWQQVSVDNLEQVAVIDDNTRKTLFADSDPIGQVIFLGRLPVRIVGVTAPQESAFGDGSSLTIWVPYTTLSGRMLGQKHLNNIVAQVSDQIPSAAAEQGIISLLTMRHGKQDFFTMNTDTIRQNIEETTATMTLLISAIAVISLIVGGIGVMNIMLVSVTERTKEIGVRMAVGARQIDILRQFLIESILVCLCGGFAGIALSFGLGMLIDSLNMGFNMLYSTASIVWAFVCSTLIGIIFGFLPARNAARLDPVDALSRD